MNSEFKSFMLLDSLVGLSILLLVVALVSLSTREFNKLENTAYYQLLDAQALLNKSEESVQNLPLDKLQKEGIQLTTYDGKKLQLFVLEK